MIALKPELAIAVNHS